MGKVEREKGKGSGNGRMREVWMEWRQLRGKGLDGWNGEELWMGGTIGNNGKIKMGKSGGSIGGVWLRSIEEREGKERKREMEKGFELYRAEGRRQRECE
ncbi:hypothetical protein ACJW31_01G265500 [Castanea mollissima]